jgi:hypothetical protein
VLRFLLCAAYVECTSLATCAIRGNSGNNLSGNLHT